MNCRECPVNLCGDVGLTRGITIYYLTKAALHSPLRMIITNKVDSWLEVRRPVIIIAVIILLILIPAVIWYIKSEDYESPVEITYEKIQDVVGCINELPEDDMIPYDKESMNEFLVENQLCPDAPEVRLLDAWGRPIVIERVAERYRWRFISYGRDGVAGNRDDIILMSNTR